MIQGRWTPPRTSRQIRYSDNVRDKDVLRTLTATLRTHCLCESETFRSNKFLAYRPKGSIEAWHITAHGTKLLQMLGYDAALPKPFRSAPPVNEPYQRSP